MERVRSDLGEQLAVLENYGELTRVRSHADPRFELSAISKHLSPGPAILFERVKGGFGPVVIGTDGTRCRIARLLGVEENRLMDHYATAIANPLPPTYVAEGAVQQVVRSESMVDLERLLPPIVHYEGDAGPSITSGLVLVNLPNRGLRNLSFHRMQVTGPREMRITIFPRHLAALVQEYRERSLPLPAVVVIGCVTAVRLAAATSGAHIPLGYDEIALAGSLQGSPIELVSALSIDGLVPARAQIAIEGVILPGVWSEEGPFAQSTGAYSKPADRQVFHVSTVTSREIPIYQDLLVGSSEHLLLQSVPQELVVLLATRGVVPGVRAVHVSPWGCGKFHAVISMTTSRDGEGKAAILAALGASPDLKLVVAVDDDVDPFVPEQVEWAVATRFQSDRDLVVISGASGNPIDPSARNGITSKMGIDATCGSGAEKKQKLRIPGYDEVNVADYL